MTTPIFYVNAGRSLHSTCHGLEKLEKEEAACTLNFYQIKPAKIKTKFIHFIGFLQFYSTNASSSVYITILNTHEILTRFISISSKESFEFFNRRTGKYNKCVTSIHEYKIFETNKTLHSYSQVLNSQKLGRAIH